MRRWALVIVIISAIVGGVFASISTSQHIRLQMHGFEQESFCAISESVNCDIVNGSSYSEMFGIPVAWFGVIFYAIVVIFALLSFLSKKPQVTAMGFVYIMSMGSLIYSAYLAYIAFIVLEVVCIACISMYIANIFIFIFTSTGMGLSLRRAMCFIGCFIQTIFFKKSYQFDKMGLVMQKDQTGIFENKAMPHIAVMAGCVIVGMVIILNILPQQTHAYSSDDMESLLVYHYKKSLYQVDVDKSWAMWGNPDAKVTLVEYSEYKCPYCKYAAFKLKPFLQEFKNDIRFVFINFPLDKTCNPDLKQQIHAGACKAAKSGICAQAQGKFWQMHDALFRNQRRLNNSFYKSTIKKLGLDADVFNECLMSDQTKVRLDSELASAKKAMVHGTPSIFLNGRKIGRWQNIDYMRELIREEIKRQKLKK